MPRISSELSISQLEKILRDRRGKIGSLEKKRAKIVRQLETIDAQIAGMGGSVRTGGIGSRVRNEMNLNDSIALVLKKAGGALKVAQIVDHVKATGYKSNSENFRGIVNQALIKDKRFAKSGVRGSYVLKK